MVTSMMALVEPGGGRGRGKEFDTTETQSSLGTLYWQLTTVLLTPNNRGHMSAAMYMHFPVSLGTNYVYRITFSLQVFSFSSYSLRYIRCHKGFVHQSSPSAMVTTPVVAPISDSELSPRVIPQVTLATPKAPLLVTLRATVAGDDNGSSADTCDKSNGM